MKSNGGGVDVSNSKDENTCIPVIRSGLQLV